MRENHDAEDILPLLARLARAAAPASDAWIYAHRHLAELGVEHDPWRAALFARRVIALRPDDDGAWAVLGLAQSLLSNFRYAARAYEHALSLAPDNPWYAHNLGHLYDVALDHPADALPLLGRATLAQPDEADIAASYAHALARCGKIAQARRVLRRAIRRGGTADQMALSRWLDAGAPPRWTPESRASTPKPTAASAVVPLGESLKPPVSVDATRPTSHEGGRPPGKGDENPDTPRPKRPRRRRRTSAE